MFELHYGVQEITEGYKVVRRVAVKGIVIKENKVLLLHTNKGDYKLPGGGMEKDEKQEDTLRREMLEETGYIVTSIGDIAGKAIEQSIDKFDDSKYFVMVNDYRYCEVDNTKIQSQNLDDYEKEQEFHPVFVEIKEAITNNKNIMEDSSVDINSWVKRETDVLECLITLCK